MITGTTVVAFSSLYFCFFFIVVYATFLGTMRSSAKGCCFYFFFCLRTKANYIFYLHPLLERYIVRYRHDTIIILHMYWTHADSGHTFNYLRIQNSFSSAFCFWVLLFELLWAFACWRAYVINETETTKIFSISFTPFFSASWPKANAKAATMAAPTAAAAASTHTLLASVKRKQIVYKVQQVFVFAAALLLLLLFSPPSTAAAARRVSLRAELSYATHSTMTLWLSQIQNGNDSALHKNSNKNGINVVCFYIVIVCPVFWPLTHLRHALGRCNGFTRLRLAIFKMGTQFAILLALLLWVTSFQRE